jgi:NTE family protein
MLRVDASRRTLVLGSGGTTGLAWEVGVLAGLADAGIDVTTDRIVGTSAGALLGARLASDWTVAELAGLRDVRSFWSLRSRREPSSDGVTKGAGSPGGVGEEPAALLDVSLPVPALARLIAAQLYPSRRHALAWLGRRATREWTAAASDAWVRQVAGDLVGRPWPEQLIVVATDATSGRPAFFSARQPADLAAAVAASCAMPGVFPAVRIDGRLLFDGGLRSPVNLDAAGPAGVVLAIAPLTGALRPDRRPTTQAALLRRAGASVLLLSPDAAGRRGIGVDVMAAGRVGAAYRAGRALAVRRADEVRVLWDDPGRSG